MSDTAFPHRRRSDDVQAKIDDWEQLKADVGRDGSEGLAAYIDGELDRLRFEKAQRDRPFVGGRRVGDPTPGWN